MSQKSERHGGGHESVRLNRQGRETVEFSVKGPVSVNINDEPSNASGVSLLDIIFTTPSTVGEITFRNYYTMWLTVLVKTKILPAEPGNGTNIGSLPSNPHKEDVLSDWTVSVPKKVLMPFPHQENGSHDLISISCSESKVEWKNLVAMKFVLRQPSPVWRTFHVEEINVYKDIPRRAPKESSADSIMNIIKRQTLSSLRWIPKPESPCGGYEFVSLPQP